MNNRFWVLLLILLISNITFGDIKLGFYNGIRFNKFEYSSMSYSPGLVFNKDSKLSARLLLDFQGSYERNKNYPSYIDITVIPDISVSYAVLRRMNSNVCIGIGFTTEFSNMATGYVPIAAEYFINKDFSFYTNVRIGAFYSRSDDETSVYGGIFGGEFGVIFYL